MHLAEVLDNMGKYYDKTVNDSELLLFGFILKKWNPILLASKKHKPDINSLAQKCAESLNSLRGKNCYGEGLLQVQVKDSMELFRLGTRQLKPEKNRTDLYATDKRLWATNIIQFISEMTTGDGGLSRKLYRCAEKLLLFSIQPTNMIMLDSRFDVCNWWSMIIVATMLFWNGNGD
jgi:hypothetical protein